ncbi:MAG: hypothetical protein WC624_03300 [Candidatus Margulisiibacteriota bacterium]
MTPPKVDSKPIIQTPLGRGQARPATSAPAPTRQSSNSSHIPYSGGEYRPSIQASDEVINLETSARGLLGLYASSDFRNCLDARDHEIVDGDFNVLQRLLNDASPHNRALMREAIIRLKGNLLSILMEKREQFRSQMLSQIGQFREQLRTLYDQEKELGAQGHAAMSLMGPSGLTYQFATNRAFNQGTTIADRERSTRNIGNCSSVPDLIMFLNQLEGEVRDNKPVSIDRLHALQGMADNPVIRNALQAIEVGIAVEKAKVAVITTSITAIGAVTGGLAAEAFVFAGGSSVVGSLVIEPVVFTMATSLPLRAIDMGTRPFLSGPNDSKGWNIAKGFGEDLLTNMLAFGLVRGSNAVMTGAPGYAKFSVNFSSLNTVNFGSQVLHSNNPADVFATGNLLTTFISSLPVAISSSAGNNPGRQGQSIKYAPIKFNSKPFPTVMPNYSRYSLWANAFNPKLPIQQPSTAF